MPFHRFLCLPRSFIPTALAFGFLLLSGNGGGIAAFAAVMTNQPIKAAYNVRQTQIAQANDAENMTGSVFSDMPPSDYNPPAEVPIPQPKLKTGTASNTPEPVFSDSAQSKDGSYQAPEQAAENAVTPPSLPQNLPIPTPAPAVNNAGSTSTIGLAEAQKAAQNLADKFSQIRTMMGNFVQFDARGGTSTGTFYLERPGKILFDYRDTPLRVICDGSTIAVNNRRLRSWNLYDLSKSPLSLLLADKINIANGRLLEFTQEPTAITLVLGDATGHAKIMLIFDAKTYALKQWTMTENGQDTTIQIMDTKTGIEFEPNMFNINYYRFPKKR